MERESERETKDGKQKDFPSFFLVGDEGAGGTTHEIVLTVS